MLDTNDTHLSGRMGYRPALDGLRAVAVLAVIAYHYWGETRLLTIPGTDHPVSFGGGYLGVDVFFVLSGFLITRLLLEEQHRHGAISLATFYVRRGARLLPALFTLLAFVALYTTLSPRHEFSEVRTAVLAGAFYVANWFGAAGYDLEPLGHLWSLSVEEQFYLVWPLVLVALRSRRGPVMRVAAVVAAVAALDMLVRSLAGQGEAPIYFSTDSRGAWSLMVGCLVATFLRVDHEPTSASPRLAALAVGTTAVVAAFMLLTPSLDVMTRGGFAVVLLAIVGLLVATLRYEPLRRLLATPVLVWTGRLSYSLYLWHVVVYAYLRDAMPGQRIDSVYNVLCVVASLVAASMSYYLVESPIRAHVSAWWANRHRPSVATVALAAE